jgi:hypothetical protein
MKQTHIRLKEDVFLWIKEQAKKQNRNVSNYINHFFESLYLKEQDDKDKDKDKNNNNHDYPA